jgi:hypothetical protein
LALHPCTPSGADIRSEPERRDFWRVPREAVPIMALRAGD